MKISLNVQAELELVEGASYYAREANAEIANAFVSEFYLSAKLLSEFPKLGATWRGRVRRLPLRRFPYSIVYYLRDSEVCILAVAHQRRRPGFWKGANVNSRHVRSNRSFDAATHRQCAASRAREHTPRGAIPPRAGQRRR